MAIVYGSPNSFLRKRLWDELRKDTLDMEGPWLAIGDFNAVLSSSDVNDPVNFSQRRCAGFSEWVFERGLVEVAFEGPCMTWKRGNHDNTFKAARLDRALADGDWMTMFHNAIVQHLPMVYSDHAPLLLSTEGKAIVRRNRHFRFQASWFANAGLDKEIRDAWNNDASFVSNINKHFGSIRKRKDKLLARLAGIQRKLMSGGHGGLIKLEKRIQKELDEVLAQEEIHWFQNSREEWITSGERNTRFYHLATIIRRAKNKVAGLRNDNGDMVTGKDDQKRIMTNYFKNLFQEDKSCRLDDAPRGGFPLINPTNKDKLLQEFSEEEIKQALWTWLL